MIRKILNILLWIILPLAIIVVGKLAQQYSQNKDVTKLKIDIQYSKEKEINQLLTYEDVNSFIFNKYDSIQGKKIEDVNIELIEKDLLQLPYVKNIDAFTTFNGEVNIVIQQRRAIIRIIDRRGNNYYLDEDGRILPTRSYYPARVPVCNGAIPNLGVYSQEYSPLQFDSLLENTILKDIFRMAKYIDNDTLMSKQIVQLNVNEKGEFTLIPLVSSQIIKFGEATDIAVKFDNLKLFYKQGLGHHKWKRYKEISLEYKNQIVCTKY